MTGKLIVLEGIDGCGKSTQIQHLSQWLPRSGLMPQKSNLHLTREPGGTSLGSSLRDFLLNPSEGKAPEPLTELFLYAADRAQHIAQIIKPILERGDWVLSDRFSGSTLAYQGYGRDLNQDIIKELELIALQGIKPDITIWIDLSYEESMKRRNGRIKDRIESEGAFFLQKVAAGFAQIAEERAWIRIPGELNSELVSQSIEEEIKKVFNL